MVVVPVMVVALFNAPPSCVVVPLIARPLLAVVTVGAGAAGKAAQVALPVASDIRYFPAAAPLPARVNVPDEGMIVGTFKVSVLVVVPVMVVALFNAPPSCVVVPLIARPLLAVVTVGAGAAGKAAQVALPVASDIRYFPAAAPLPARVNVPDEAMVVAPVTVRVPPLCVFPCIAKM